MAESEDWCVFHNAGTGAISIVVHCRMGREDSLGLKRTLAPGGARWSRGTFTGLSDPPLDSLLRREICAWRTFLIDFLQSLNAFHSEPSYRSPSKISDKQVLACFCFILLLISKERSLQWAFLWVACSH